MKKRYVLSILFLLVSGLVNAQVFTSVITGFNGAISGNTNTVSYAPLSGDNVNMPKKDTSVYTRNIFIDAPTPVYKRGPYYYYVFSSCYCDPSGGDHPSYNMYISNVHLESSPYCLNYRFNDLLLKLVPDWSNVNPGHRTSNAFLTRKEAKESRKMMIDSYRTTHFKIHYLNW